MEFQGHCASCHVKDRICRKPNGSGPKFCSTLLYEHALQKAAAEYQKEDIHQFALQASLQEAEGYIDRDAVPAYKYPIKPRVQEIIEFCRRMNYEKLGVAFCGGLHREADIFCKILDEHGFRVVSVMCKVGGVDKAAIGITEQQKVQVGSFEPMCNPIAQAEILNEAQTHFNILLGLCVGHDSLFLRYAKAMTTVLAVKDRVLGHNPLACIYTYDTYSERFKQDRLKEIEVKK